MPILNGYEYRFAFSTAVSFLVISPNIVSATSVTLPVTLDLSHPGSCWWLIRDLSAGLVHDVIVRATIGNESNFAVELSMYESYCIALLIIQSNVAGELL